MGQVMWLSLVTASVAFTMSETALFMGLRERASIRSAALGKLASCGYCLGHWVAFGLVAIYRPRLFNAWAPLDYFNRGCSVPATETNSPKDTKEAVYAGFSDS